MLFRMRLKQKDACEICAYVKHPNVQNKHSQQKVGKSVKEQQKRKKKQI